MTTLPKVEPIPVVVEVFDGSGAGTVAWMAARYREEHDAPLGVTFWPHPPVEVTP